MANSVDPDEMPHSAASHLGLHCLTGMSIQIHMVNTVLLITIKSAENVKKMNTVFTLDVGTNI